MVLLGPALHRGNADRRDGLSLAACHSCVLSPETSCEEFNRFLDRAMLVGIPANAATGFFGSMISGDT